MRSRYMFPVSGTFANLSRFRDGFRIDSIGVGSHFRGNGFGSLMLKQLCQEADKEGLPLWLVVCPDDDSPLQWEELQNWYARFGFVRREDLRIYYKREPVCGQLSEMRSDESKNNGIVAWIGVN